MWRPPRIRLAPLVCAIGLAPLVVGLLVARRLGEKQPPGLRVAGTSVAIAGAAISLAALVLAWPDPAVLLPAVVAEFVLFEAIVLAGRMPAAQVVAVASAALGYLIGVYLLRGEVDWWGATSSSMRPILWSGASGAALVRLVALLAIGGWCAQWRARRADALFIAGATSVVACVSLLLVSWFGAGVVGDPLGARWVYAVYAAAALVVAGAASRLLPSVGWPLGLAWLGSLLTLAAVVEAVVFRWAPVQQWAWPWPAALAAHAGLMVLLALGLRQFGRGETRGPLESASIQSALASSCAAVPLIGWGVHLGLYSASAAQCVALATIWLALAAVRRSQNLFWWTQAALSFGVAFAVAARLGAQAWFRESPRPWLDPWTWQAIGIALVLVGLTLIGLRGGWRRLAVSRPDDARIELGRWLIVAQRPAFDRLLTALLVGIAFVLAYYSALPGIQQELSPRGMRGATAAAGPTAVGNPAISRDVPPIGQFEVAGVPHEHASGWGGWCLLGATAVLLLAGFWQRPTMWHILGIYLVAAACCPVWASRWEGDVAVASALRWASAALLVAGSIPIWLRDPLCRFAARCSPRLGRPWCASPAAGAAAVFALALAPPALMAVYIGTAASLRVDHDPATLMLLRILMGVFVAASIVGVALRSVELPITFAVRRTAPVAWLRQTSSLLLVLGTAPLVALVLYVVGSALQHTPILGPDPDSLFARMGSASSHAVPLLTLALVLVGYALRERSEGFAFAGGLTFNLAITAGYLLLISKQGLRFDAVGWMRLAQLNALVSAVYALAWMGTVHASARRSQESGRDRLSPLMLTTLGLAATLLLLVVVPVWAHFAFQALDVDLASEVASATGWASTALLSRRCCGPGAGRGGPVRLAVCGAGLFVLGVMTACTAAHWDTGNALAYHTLLVVQSAIAWIVWAMARLDLRISDRSESHAGEGDAITIQRLLPSGASRARAADQSRLGDATGGACAVAQSAGARRRAGPSVVGHCRPGLARRSGDPHRVCQCRAAVALRGDGARQSFGQRLVADRRGAFAVGLWRRAAGDADRVQCHRAGITGRGLGVSGTVAISPLGHAAHTGRASTGRPSQSDGDGAVGRAGSGGRPDVAKPAPVHLARLVCAGRHSDCGGGLSVGRRIARFGGRPVPAGPRRSRLAARRAEPRSALAGLDRHHCPGCLHGADQLSVEHPPPLDRRGRTLENPRRQRVAAGRTHLAGAGQSAASDRRRGAGLPDRAGVRRVFAAVVGRASGTGASAVDCAGRTWSAADGFAIRRTVARRRCARGVRLGLARSHPTARRPLGGNQRDPESAGRRGRRAGRHRRALRIRAGPVARGRERVRAAPPGACCRCSCR